MWMRICYCCLPVHVILMLLLMWVYKIGVIIHCRRLINLIRLFQRRSRWPSMWWVICWALCLIHDVTSSTALSFFTQLKVDGTSAYVELILKLPEGKSIDLTNEVYNADVMYIQSMEFVQSTKKGSTTSKSLPPPPDSNNDLTLPIPSAVGSTEKISLDTPLSPLTLFVSDNVSVNSRYLEASIICEY